MKNLHKKIGAMVLAGAIVIGGCLSNVSFAHASALNIYEMASYNSNNPEDNKIFIKEFGGWFNEILGQKQEIKDLNILFNDMSHLKKYLEEKEFPEGIYLASIKPRPGIESSNLNILFRYE